MARIDPEGQIIWRWYLLYPVECQDSTYTWAIRSYQASSVLQDSDGGFISTFNGCGTNHAACDNGHFSEAWFSKIDAEGHVGALNDGLRRRCFGRQDTGEAWTNAIRQSNDRFSEGRVYPLFKVF